MMFINGVMFGIARGDHPIRSATHLDRYLSAIVRGVGLPPPGRRPGASESVGYSQDSPI
jgi:hypothetical protein